MLNQILPLKLILKDFLCILIPKFLAQPMFTSCKNKYDLLSFDNKIIIKK